MNSRTKRILRSIGKLLIAAGVLMLLYVFFTDFYTGYQQRKLASQWSEVIASESEKRIEPPDEISLRDKKKNDEDESYYKELKEKEAFAKLVIPKIGLDVVVVEGTGVADLKKGPGHIKGTALPGKGNTAISGHRVTYSRPFFRIDELTIGDSIILYTPNNKYIYRVAEKRTVRPSDVSVIQPTKDVRLTLTACHPPYSARYRIVIIAKLLPRSKKMSPE